MAGLYSLNLKGKSITDAQVRSIKSHSGLKILEISETAVTNTSLKHVLENFPNVFSVRAEKVAFDTGIFDIVRSIPTNRQFDVTVSKTAVSRDEVKSAGESVARHIKVTGGW